MKNMTAEHPGIQPAEADHTGTQEDYSQLLSRMEEQDWQAALHCLALCFPAGTPLNADYYILLASICEGMKDYSEMFRAIRAGLKLEPRNYELYLLLGNYYARTNPDQAYLCYENAAFYCDNEADLQTIHEIWDALASTQEIHVRPVSIVILSYNSGRMTQECIQSLRYTLPPASFEIIVVDNASTDGITEWLSAQPDMKLIQNDTNVGFPAGCNQGIKAAAPDNDIFLLNNDTYVPDNSIFWLRMGLYESAQTGACGSVTNYAANHQAIPNCGGSRDELLRFAASMNLPCSYPYEKKIWLIGFALLLKRTALDEIGLLDTRFSPGNYEDTDIGLRLAQAGYQQLLCKNSFIIHYGSQGFSRDIPKYSHILQTNREKLTQKWGMDMTYYFNARMELLEFITHKPDDTFHVLEVGCGLGCTLAKIQSLFPNAHVTGIELNEKVASLGKQVVDIIPGNIETMELPYPMSCFDYIIFADVLEHLYDPEKILKRMRPYLKPHGCIIASIPNIMHYSVILPLLCGHFTYQDAGILDRTHIRFFTANECVEMFKRCGYATDPIRCTNYSIPLDDTMASLKQQLLSLRPIANRQLFDAYQFLISARPCKG